MYRAKQFVRNYANSSTRAVAEPKRRSERVVTLDKEELMFVMSFCVNPPHGKNMWSRETLIAALAKMEVDEYNNIDTISKRQFMEKVLERGQDYVL